MSKRGKRRPFQPAGTEFVGKCRQIERIAKELNIPFSEIRLADLLYFDGNQWTIRSIFERRVGNQWTELPWSPKTHSISIKRSSVHPPQFQAEPDAPSRKNLPGIP